MLEFHANLYFCRQIVLSNFMIMSHIKNPFVKYAILFMLLVVSFFLFVLFSAFLPSRIIQRHVYHAAKSLNEAGNYPRALIDEETCRLDNFTDALILNQIYSVDRHEPLRSAMRVSRWQTEPAYDQTGSLYLQTRHAEGLEEVDYNYYWHGSTFLYRFLLLFFSFSQLKLLMYVTVFLLLLFFLRSYYPLAGAWNSMAFLFSWMLVYGFVMPASLQFFPILAISLIASLLVIRYRKNPQALGVVFFVTASLSAFFDLLTVPLLTFGWSVAVWLSLPAKKPLTLSEGFRNLLVWGLSWVAGYVLTFLAKWLLGAAVLGGDVLSNAFQSGLYRVGAEDFSRWDALVLNIKLLPTKMVLITVVLFLAAGIFRSRGSFGVRGVLLLLVALMPYLWYLVFSNHSYQHYWFTYRLQAVTLCAVLMALLGSSRRQFTSKM